MKKLFMFSVVFLLAICLCILSVEAAFAAMLDEKFIELCANGTPQQIQVAIKSGANVNAKSKDGWTPLLETARCELLEFVNRCVRRGRYS